MKCRNCKCGERSFVGEALHLAPVEPEELPALLRSQVGRAERLVEFLRRVPVENVKIEATAVLIDGELYVGGEELLADAELAVVGLHVNVFEEERLALPCRVREEADCVADESRLVLIVR